MVKPVAGYRPLAYSSPEPVQTTGTVAYRERLAGVLLPASAARGSVCLRDSVGVERLSLARPATPPRGSPLHPRRTLPLAVRLPGARAPPRPPPPPQPRLSSQQPGPSTRTAAED